MSDSLPKRDDDGWSRHGWLLPGVWLLFLGYTVWAVLNSGTGPAGVVLGIALVLLYAAIYLGAFLVLMKPSLERFRFPGWEWAGLAAMCAAVVLEALVIGPMALFMAPFIVAYSCYLFPRRTAWLLGLASIAAAAAAMAAYGAFGQLFFVLVIMAGVFAVNMVQSAMMDATERAELLRTDLAVVSERERVARDVHDGLGHTLTVVAMKAELAERVMDSDPERARAELAALHRMVRDALGEVRSTVGGLRANDLPTQAEALGIVLRGAGLDVVVEGDPAAVDPELQTTLGWVLREAGTNVLRHARATRCTLRFGPRSMQVEDDGVGLGSSPAGHGRRGMAERLAAVGADLRVGAGPAGGTLVEAAW